MGRWNDLIGVLQRTADVSTGRRRRRRSFCGASRRCGSTSSRTTTRRSSRSKSCTRSIRPMRTRSAAARHLRQAPLVAGAARSRAQGARAADEAGRSSAARKLVRDGEARGRSARRRARGDRASGTACSRHAPDDGEALHGAGRALRAREALAGAHRDAWAAGACQAAAISRTQVRAAREDGHAVLGEADGAGARRSRRTRRSSRIMPSHHEGDAHAARAVRAGRALRRARGALRGQGQWEELCEMLHVGRRARARRPTQKIRLYSRVAEIAQHELKSPERAAKAYERILAVDAREPRRGAARWCRSIARARSGRACSRPTRSSSAPTTANGDERAGDRAASRDRRAVRGEARLEAAWRSPGRPRRIALAPADAALEKRARAARRRGRGVGRAGRDLRRPRSREEPDEARKVERHRQLGAHRAHAAAQARGGAPLLRGGARSARPTTTRRSRRSSRSSRRRANYTELLAIYRKREARATDPQRAARAALQDRAGSRRSSSAIRWRRRRPTARSSTTDDAGDADAGAARAREAATRRAATGRRHGRRARAAAGARRRATTRTRGSSCRSGSARCYELNLEQPDARARSTISAAFALSPSHKPTLAALERWLKPEAKADDASRWRGCSCRSTSSAGDDDESAAEARRRAGHRARRRDRIRRASCRCCGASWSSSATRLGDAERAYGYARPHVRARAGRRREPPRMMAMLADQLEQARRLAVQLGEAERAADKARRRRRWRAISAGTSGSSSTRGSACPTTPSRPTGACSRATTTNEDAQVALVQLYSVNERWRELRALLERKKARALDRRARGCRCSSRSAISTRACSTTPRRRRAITSRCSSSIRARSAPSARSSASTRRDEKWRDARRAARAAHSLRRRQATRRSARRSRART